MAATNSASISNWYTQAYSGSFRTGRLRASSNLPPRNLAQAHANAVQHTLVVDVARQLGINVDGDETAKNVRRRETIFGPDVGEDDEPGWTKRDEGVKVGVDVVKGWVDKAKSEEGLHATTTLQALVNLKRPTLLLQQLEGDDVEPTRASLDADGEIEAASPSKKDIPVPQRPLHSLKFNYDATSPQVNITLLIYPSPVPMPEGKESFVLDEEPTVVYTGVHSGGFDQLFTLPASSALDLSSAIAPPPGSAEDMPRDSHDEKKLASNNDTIRARTSQSAETNRSSRRRFGFFSRRQNEERDLEAANIEMTPRVPSAVEKEEEKEEEKGMRILIKIDALGAEGETLQRRNAQLTHILITGMWTADARAAPSTVTAAPSTPTGKRVWVVKVVRREAIIGPHTFLLKEIYGLSSAGKDTTHNHASYPPGADDHAHEDLYASTPNECIVCLTAPRDVVLLPCRHLVVCRECAVGMIEFGAGGKVSRRDDTTAAEPAEGDASPPAADVAVPTPVTPVAGGTTQTGRERRKKKPKGWYCPVCRQPYTSLLRLALPTTEERPSNPNCAPSIRSFRSHKAPSIAPTLPEGAEEMLEALRPPTSPGPNESAEEVSTSEQERPQFVLGPEEPEESTQNGFEAGKVSEEGRSKGWREV
ncbi:hypothetical protein M231_01094 [Tremella mesenterica]|uniref:RING-type domain-containing protein n=1 Tax=Tremella mesenterica TaxID=5217 RepID=A0A4Q1BU65_TREME|nr:hypothetical protein M231_01094 [Tremella mesenterica]